ncbi:MAG: nitroreductase family protein [Saonia sp.]
METENIFIRRPAHLEHKIHPLLEQRWSPRTFGSKQISESEIARLFEAARWAASSFNVQPWRFIYAAKKTRAYDKIIDCLSDFNGLWATNAPLLMLTAYKEKTEEGEENFHALHDLGLCLGNMSVQAQYLGIAMHHMAGIDWKKAQRVFDVPKGFHITSALALGYYGGDIQSLPEDLQGQETGKRTRNRIEDFAYNGSWKK